MKKSLLALFLALVMCISLFCTGCSSSGEEEDADLIKTDAEIEPVTITLYAPTEGTTTQKQVEEVQKAFSAITESQYNTRVVLKLIPEDEYEDVVFDILEKQKKKAEEEEAALDAGVELPEEEKTETKKDASDENKYPEVKENQMDIFLVHSFETFYNLAHSEDFSGGQLAPLDDDLAETGKLLYSYVYPYLLRSAKVDGQTYGIFNNTIFGGQNAYKYLLLNKELVDKYEYNPEKMKDLASISLFLREVKAGEADVVPFLGDIEAPVIYWDNTESIIGSYLGTSLTSSGKVDAKNYVPSPLHPGNLFSSSDFQTWMTEYNLLNRENIFVEKTEENKDAKFAATIIEGDVTLSPTYWKDYGNYKQDEFGFKYVTIDGVDYYVSVYSRPLATNENVFNSGYVVSKYTENTTRCMEVLKCLYTDAQLANIFMYGIKDIHYSVSSVNGEDVVTKLTDTYAMDIENVGNMYLLMPSDDMNDEWKFLSANKWQNAKNTNHEAVMSPYLGFYYSPTPPEPVEPDPDEENPKPTFTIDATFDEAIAEIQKLSPEFFENAKNFVPTDTMDMASYLRSIVIATNKIDYVKAITSSEANFYYTMGAYRTWYQEHYNKTLDLG